MTRTTITITTDEGRAMHDHDIQRQLRHLHEMLHVINGKVDLLLKLSQPSPELQADIDRLNDKAKSLAAAVAANQPPVL